MYLVSRVHVCVCRNQISAFAANTSSACLAVLRRAGQATTSHPPNHPNHGPNGVSGQFTPPSHVRIPDIAKSDRAVGTFRDLQAAEKTSLHHWFHGRSFYWDTVDRAVTLSYRMTRATGQQMVIGVPCVKYLRKTYFKLSVELQVTSSVW